MAVFVLEYIPDVGLQRLILRNALEYMEPNGIIGSVDVDRIFPVFAAEFHLTTSSDFDHIQLGLIDMVRGVPEQELEVIRQFVSGHTLIGVNRPSSG